jgi:hypothetical protein
MMVLAIPTALLVRIGIEEGFERYELPALGCAALLIVIFPLFDAPLGLGSSLIIAALISRRAGPVHGGNHGDGIMKPRRYGQRVKKAGADADGPTLPGGRGGNRRGRCGC